MQQQWRGIVFTFRYIPLLLYRAYIDLHEDVRNMMEERNHQNTFVWGTIRQEMRSYL